LLKNFLNLLTGEFAARALQALGMVILTRQLGKDGVGVYGLAAAIASYGQLLIMLGIDPIAIRGMQQKTLDPHNAVGRIFSLRLAAAAMLVALAAVYALTGRPDGVVLLVLSTGYLANALTPRWLLLAAGDMRPLAVAGALSQACFLAVVIFAPHGAVIAAAGASAGEALAAGYCYWSAHRHTTSMTMAWDSEFHRALLREARPVAISLVMGTMMTNFDVLALALMGRRDQIGLYVSAYRPLTFFAPLLAVLQNTILPKYASAWPDYSKIRSHVRLLAAATFLAMTAAALLLFWQAPLVLRLLFGAPFLEGTPLLRVLVWTLVPQGVRCVFRQVLYAFRKEQIDSWNVQGAVVTNALIDFALIPKLGALGCAISTVVSETVYLAATWDALRRRVSRSNVTPP
jgi:O-antigen/teichoic acid export membrane protein